MRIVYAGTPAYVIPPFEAILNSDHEVSLVVTPPDRVSGRGQSSDAPPLKKAAVDHGVTVFQPESINDPTAVNRLADVKPDLMVVASFGKIVNQAVLDVPDKAAINIHPSCLPKYRGPSPVAQAILDAQENTCVTIFEMDDKMDHGPIVECQEVSIGFDETTEQLRKRLFERAAELLPGVLKAYEEGGVVRVEQEHEQATYTSFFSKEDGRIDWRRPAADIYRQIRAFKPWPNTFSLLKMDGRSSALRIGIHNGRPTTDDADGEPGTIAEVSGEGLIVRTGENRFRITEVQPANKQAMSIEDFINGYQPEEGDRFLNP